MALKNLTNLTRLQLEKRPRQVRNIQGTVNRWVRRLTPATVRVKYMIRTLQKDYFKCCCPVCLELIVLNSKYLCCERLEFFKTEVT